MIMRVRELEPEGWETHGNSKAAGERLLVVVPVALQADLAAHMGTNLSSLNLSYPQRSVWTHTHQVHPATRPIKKSTQCWRPVCLGVQQPAQQRRGATQKNKEDTRREGGGYECCGQNHHHCQGDKRIVYYIPCQTGTSSSSLEAVGFVGRCTWCARGN